MKMGLLGIDRRPCQGLLISLLRRVCNNVDIRFDFNDLTDPV
jgi:hypothetical protein